MKAFLKNWCTFLLSTSMSCYITVETAWSMPQDASAYWPLLPIIPDVTYCHHITIAEGFDGRSIRRSFVNYLDYEPSYPLQSAPPKNKCHLLAFFYYVYLFLRMQFFQSLPTKSLTPPHPPKKKAFSIFIHPTDQPTQNFWDQDICNLSNKKILAYKCLTSHNSINYTFGILNCISFRSAKSLKPHIIAFSHNHNTL